MNARDEPDKLDQGKRPKSASRVKHGIILAVCGYVVVGGCIAIVREFGQVPPQAIPAVREADTNREPNLVATFAGFGSESTSVFEVHDKWEARWESETSPTLITCTRLDTNGEKGEPFAIFGKDFSNRRIDSSYIEEGGRYSIEFSNVGGPWSIQIYQW